MANKKDKDPKKGGKVELTNVTEENVVDQIKNANRFSEEIVKEAEEKAEKDEKERMVRELNEIKDKATYINLSSVLKTRLVRAQEKAVSKLREASRDLLGDIKSGKLTANEYNQQIDEKVKDCNKAIEEAIKEYENNKKELKTKFPASWCYEWDNPFRRIRSIDRD
jgi:hypothetical protein